MKIVSPVNLYLFSKLFLCLIFHLIPQDSYHGLSLNLISWVIQGLNGKGYTRNFFNSKDYSTTCSSVVESSDTGELCIWRANSKLYMDFLLCDGSAPLAPMLLKGQKYLFWYYFQLFLSCVFFSGELWFVRTSSEV